MRFGGGGGGGALCAYVTDFLILAESPQRIVTQPDERVVGNTEDLKQTAQARIIHVSEGAIERRITSKS